ncbi:MAG: hypothetical protein LC776_14800 [Acidobacteria bacterium]|nr:hypothetical protein [Acidobacteriota bacterium]
MFNNYIKCGAIILVIACSNISSAVAQCNTSGDDLVNRIDFEIIPKAVQVLEAIPDPGREASMAALATAVTEIGEICTCNIDQSAYVSISLSQISLLRTLTICKYDVPPESFQQCSSAANAGLITVRNTKSVLGPVVRQASCGAVDPIPPGAIPLVQQEVFDATQRVASSLSRRSPVALRKILRRGRLVRFNPQADGTAQVSLDAIQAIAGGKISVPVANGTAVAVPMLPVEINLQMIRGGNKNLRSQRTKKLRLTITFTMNDGRAFSAVRTFKLKK